MTSSLRCLTVLAGLLAMASAPAFEVTKNINTGKPPVEKVLLFAKDKPHDHITFACTGTGALSFADDGAIVSTITGGGSAAPRIGWKPGDGRPAAFDTTAYTYLILVCRLEGTTRTKNKKGEMEPQKRGGNLWFGANLYNAAGERLSGVSLADVNEGNEGVTPAETVELRIPLLLFHGSSLADKQVAFIGTDWGATRPPQERDFRWVIDRIALAD